MQKLFILLILVFTGGVLNAQYINTDSLITIPGVETMLTIAEAAEAFPESDVIINSGNEITFGSVGELLTHFSLPATGKVISPFGWRSGRMHTGTDIKKEKGDTIYAAYDGVVSKARYYYGYGNLVVLEHPKNLETYYGHLSAFLVKNGDTVRQGQAIGLAGSTGRATTSHLHFEIRENQKPYNPELVFDFENLRIHEAVAKLDNLSETQKNAKPAVFQSNEPLKQSYTVRSGDSLWKISRRYKTSIQAICMLNNLTEQSVLQVGQVLKMF